MQASTGKAPSRKAQGVETKATLIKIGARLFALHGFHGVSMRMLAAEAGTNLSSVAYHFGSKSGLYEAIIRDVVEMQEDIFPSADEMKKRMIACQDDPKAQSAFVSWYVERLIRGILEQENNRWPIVMISHQLSQPNMLYQQVEDSILKPARDSMDMLVEFALPPEADDEEIVITSHCILVMLVRFVEDLEPILHKLKWQSYEGHGADKVVAVLSKRICGFLGLPMGA